MLRNTDYDIVQASTKRYLKIGEKFIYSGVSPNCGLLCYLCESLLSLDVDQIETKLLIKSHSKKVLSEAQLFRGKYFWGWEKKSSIPEVYFPLDWDDTCKALDFLLLASKKDIIDDTIQQFPDDSLWETEVRNSLFYSNTTGEDFKIKHKRYLALSVFFGPLSERWAKRDDPMVTLSLIRTTKLWYPEVFNVLKNEFTELLDRLIFITNYIVQKGIPFNYISRYYFSFGHYIYRLIETLELLDHKFINLFDSNLFASIEQSFLNLKYNFNDSTPKSHEYLFWYLNGLRLQYLNYEFDNPYFALKNSFNDSEFVFRHRRLNHYYISENWYKKLFYWEFNKLKNIMAINNR